jgi:hypothetical protein
LWFLQVHGASARSSPTVAGYLAGDWRLDGPGTRASRLLALQKEACDAQESPTNTGSPTDTLARALRPLRCRNWAPCTWHTPRRLEPCPSTTKHSCSSQIAHTSRGRRRVTAGWGRRGSCWGTCSCQSCMPRKRLACALRQAGRRQTRSGRAVSASGGGARRHYPVMPPPRIRAPVLGRRSLVSVCLCLSVCPSVGLSLARAGVGEIRGLPTWWLQPTALTECVHLTNPFARTHAHARLFQARTWARPRCALFGSALFRLQTYSCFRIYFSNFKLLWPYCADPRSFRWARRGWVCLMYVCARVRGQACARSCLAISVSLVRKGGRWLAWVGVWLALSSALACDTHARHSRRYMKVSFMGVPQHPTLATGTAP